MTEQFNEFMKRVYSFDFDKWPIKSRKVAFSNLFKYCLF